MAIASGTRTAVIYWREREEGVRPAGLTSQVTGCTHTATATDTFSITRGSGSWITDGYVEGQRVTLGSFDGTAAIPDGTYEVSEVTSATVLQLYSVGNAFNEATATAVGTAQIVPQTLRVTSKGFNLQRSLVESEEVRPSGMQADVRHGFNTVSGSIGFELSSGAIDDMLEGALRGRFYSFSAVDSGSDTVTSVPNTPSAGSTRFTRSAGSWIADGFRVGDWVTVSTFSTASQGNGTFQIVQLTALNMTVADPDGIVTTGQAAQNLTDTGVVTVTLAGKRVDAGTTKITFGMERQMLDVELYQEFGGIAIQSATINLDPESPVGGSMEVLGLNGGQLSATSVTASTLTPLATPTGTVYAWQDGSVYEGSLAQALITGGSITFNNQRSTEAVVGSKFSPSIFEGTMLVDAQMDAFLEDSATLFGKFFNETSSTAFYNVNDPTDAGIFLSITVPNLKYTGADMNPPQQGPITQNLPFRGLEATLAMPGATDALSSASVQVHNALGA